MDSTVAIALALKRLFHKVSSLEKGGLNHERRIAQLESDHGIYNTPMFELADERAARLAAEARRRSIALRSPSDLNP